MSWRRRFAITTLATLGALAVAHFGIRQRARLEPPTVEVHDEPVTEPAPGVRALGRSTSSSYGKLRVVHLSGTPEQIGFAQARLLRPEMVANEGILLEEFRRSVRPAPLRWLLLDLAQLRYRDLDRGLDPARRRELAASALGFAPDPFADFFPTYQRFVYLNALYDIALSFERSPLIGCTSFTFAKEAAESGHTLLARAFDFDVHDVFDEQKAVFFVRETGAIPFASVAWPGLPGVVSGMNREGLALVVHGGRAGEPRAEGEPVVHALRRVLSSARTVEEAVRSFAEREPMVSHIVIAADANGATSVIERVPGSPPHARALPAKAAVSNHFDGPAAADPKNQHVREATTTLEREARGKELVAALDHPATVEDAVRLLRDKRAPGGAALPAGDRRAIDAHIATHGVVFDSGRRRLWVSEAPHLSGRFVAFDLADEFADPPRTPTGERPSVPAEP
ncbi:MAG: hypothetical protein IPM35_36460 [Myxococcales bacterium]|nr:hypothetical protein [Myxococcales bacterium]